MNQIRHTLNRLETSIHLVTRQQTRRNDTNKGKGKRSRGKRKRIRGINSSASVSSQASVRSHSSSRSRSNSVNASHNSDLDIDFDDMASAILVQTKFVGTIKDATDPDKASLESYNVHRFLADVDALIQSKKITNDADKIK